MLQPPLPVRILITPFTAVIFVMLLCCAVIGFVYALLEDLFFGLAHRTLDLLGYDR